MVVGTLMVALRIPGAETLKDKRKVIRGMVESMRRRFGVSAAEVEDANLSGNATLGVAYVSGSAVEVESTLTAVLEFIESHPEVEVFDLVRDVERRV